MPDRNQVINNRTVFEKLLDICRVLPDKAIDFKTSPRYSSNYPKAYLPDIAGYVRAKWKAEPSYEKHQ